MNINFLLNELLNYALKKNLIDPLDFDYNANYLIDLFQNNAFQKESTNDRAIEDILEDLTEFAITNDIINSDDIVSKDNFKAKIMDSIIDKPSQVADKFNHLLKINPDKATDYLYMLSKNSNYIQVKRIAQNIEWKKSTEYGDLHLTINLSKPEKDPRLIAIQKSQKSTSYPKCQLCKENQGYRGNIAYDSRSNLRIIPVKLNNEDWYFQYSPYSYFNEHSIVLNEQHIPMIINENTFKKLCDFLDLFPGYFVGSNAGLPIVGGSILDHEHYQSGKYRFPIEEAKADFIDKINDVEIMKVNWPLSTVRLKSENRNCIIKMANQILVSWQNYHNEALLLFNSKEDIHHTITPISRKENNQYVFDLILRSNYVNKEFPDGVFHPHPEFHHIKRENIGLIEAMGLGVLPPRLKPEFDLIEQVLLGNNELINDNKLEKHLHWIKILFEKYQSENNVREYILEEAGEVFLNVLKDAGVFKNDEVGQRAFIKFIKQSI